MLIDDFNNTINTWIQGLEKYSFSQLCAKPGPSSWSLGQLYVHLIDNTAYFIDQVKICISNNDNASGEPTSAGKRMLSNNEFPDELLEGPPENQLTPQPASKEELLTKLVTLKEEMNLLAKLMTESPYHGKTKHPGLSYFAASEWMQFADMHLRHHFRQKKRIDEFLKTAR